MISHHVHRLCILIPLHCFIQIVAFWFEYLAKEFFAGTDSVTLVPGSITFLLANSGECYHCLDASTLTRKK